MMRRLSIVIGVGLAFLTQSIGAVEIRAQEPRPPVAAPSAAPSDPVLPEGFQIGAGDVLEVSFWRDKDMSAEVTVRPDGKISLPLVNDVQAAGLTPEALRLRLNEAASKFKEDPNAMVRVKAINSRQVYITGFIARPNSYPLLGPLTVVQLIAMAQGLQEFADSEHITVLRMEKGQQVTYRVNYKDVLKGRNLKQNIQLQPGDTVIVP